MQSLSITALRKQLFHVTDEVVRTGIPVEFKAKGRVFCIVLKKPSQGKLSRLQKHPVLKGKYQDLSKVKVGEWRELKNL